VTDHHRWRVLALLGAAFFMTIMDGTILFAALPSIEVAFGVDATAGQWTASAYGIAFGGLLLLCGRTADLVGRKRMFLSGIALRVVASLICGLAPNFGVLVAARALQGVSAAIIAPAALSIVITTFTEGAERDKALAIWGGLGGVGATTGLLLGGAITNLVGWQACFLINVPIGIGVLILGPSLLPHGGDGPRPRSLDPAGALTMTAALLLLVYVIIDAPSGRTAVLAAATAALIGLFVLVERRVRDPLVPFRALRSRTMIGGNVVILLAGMAVNGMLLTLTAYLQQTLGGSAMRFGLVAAAMTVMSVAGSIVTQRVVGRVGIRLVATVGTVLLAVACLMLTQGSLPMILLALGVFGLGMGATFVCAQIAALAGAAREYAGLAAGFVETSFTIGCSLGIAVCASVIGQNLLASHRIAFAVTAGFGVAGLLATLALLPRRAASKSLEMEHV
jgi:EmrB/QacA subfamily drug resistance transporter